MTRKRMNRKHLIYLTFPIALIALVAVIFSNMNPSSFKPETRIDVCDSFDYPETQIICYAFFSNNPDYCNLVDNFRVECRQFSTLKDVSQSFCEGIRDVHTKTWCFSNLAVKKRDPSICEKSIKDAAFLESCFSHIPSKYYELYSDDYCMNLTHESAKYSCLAIVRNDASYCEEIVSEPFQQNTCRASFWKDHSFCEDLESCYYDMAISQGDIELCNYISARWSKYECIGTVTKSIEKCEELEGTISKDLCKLYVLRSIELDI